MESQVQPDLRAGISQAALQQVVLNLVLNAVKALGKSSGGISIRSRMDGPGTVVVEVEDDGPGVPVAMASRVFEPFAACASGTGLGLAICNRLVQEVGGSIWIDNPGGVGARFCVRLPWVTNTKAA
jgi:two-component system NtrC family sensor kinase